MKADMKKKHIEIETKYTFYIAYKIQYTCIVEEYK